jgi:hypothetical protein
VVLGLVNRLPASQRIQSDRREVIRRPIVVSFGHGPGHGDLAEGGYLDRSMSKPTKLVSNSIDYNSLQILQIPTWRPAAFAVKTGLYFDGNLQRDTELPRWSYFRLSYQRSKRRG